MAPEDSSARRRESPRVLVRYDGRPHSVYPVSHVFTRCAT